MTGRLHTYADFWARGLAFSFDYLAIAFYLVVLTVFGLVINAAFPGILRLLFGNPISGQITDFFMITLPVTLYSALFESSGWQATWGI